MIIIPVKSLPLKDVIKDIADAFKTNYHESCSEFIIDLPEAIGQGTIKGINFDSGMGLIEYNCTFNEAIEFHFTVDEVHPLKFLFCLEGSLEHRFEGSKTQHSIPKYKQAIVSSSLSTGHILSFKKKKHTIVNSLEIVRSAFQHKIQCELGDMDPKLQHLFNDVSAKEPFYYDGYFSLKLADLFREMHAFTGSNLVKKLFLEGKAYRILTEQLKQFEDDSHAVSERNVLRKSEIHQIEAAAKLISYQISEKIGINNIATAVGLNVNKLQEGFQIMYGVTVNQFIQKTRISLISTLILNTDYSMSDIVNLTGITSKSYLSKIFRDEYGKSPSQFRKEYLSARQENKEDTE